MTRDLDTVSTVRLQAALVDWLTITTYDQTIAKYWANKIKLWDKGREVPRKQHKKIMQYEGFITYVNNGSVFWGVGIQKKVPHWMIRISGELADELAGTAARHCADGLMSCTRVDLQMTIVEPSTWSQSQFLWRMQQIGKKTGWIESESKLHGQMATVYVGSRESQRFARIYNKSSPDAGRLLRMEFEYKGELAHNTLRVIAQEKGSRAAILKSDMFRLGDTKLSNGYAHLLESDPWHVTVRKETSDDRTRRWLKEGVLPTFKRIINSHDSDGSVREMFADAIARVDTE